MFDKATIGHNSYTGTNYDFRDNVNKRIKRMVSKIIFSLTEREREREFGNTLLLHDSLNMTLFFNMSIVTACHFVIYSRDNTLNMEILTMVVVT